MFDWWNTPAVSAKSALADATSPEIVLQLLITVLMGWAVALTYYGAQRRSASEAYPFMTTLVLLTVLVSLSTYIIGDSAARAFSLVGALSIVRFRTVVEDTRDTAFVIFAVVVGMAMGSGYLTISLLSVPIVSATAIAMYHVGRSLGDPAAQRLLEIRVGSGYDPAAILAELFQRHLRSQRLVSATTTKQGVAYDLEYNVQLKPNESELTILQAINRVEGVQMVKIREGS